MYPQLMLLDVAWIDLTVVRTSRLTRARRRAKLGKGERVQREYEAVPECRCGNFAGNKIKGFEPAIAT